MTHKKVIRTYLIITGIYNLSASLIWGVNTLFLPDAGLTIFQVFIANAVFTAGMALFEIPTGVLALPVPGLLRRFNEPAGDLSATVEGGAS